MISYLSVFLITLNYFIDYLYFYQLFNSIKKNFKLNIEFYNCHKKLIN
jgi:hypothetical protein